MDFQTNLFTKNMEMWQNFSSAYMENMMSMFEKSVATSQVFQEQVQKAVEEVVNSQFELMSTSMQAMQAQMNEMAEILQKMGESGE